MKKSLVFACLLALSAVGTSFAANSAVANVTSVTYMGNLWQNANRGGFYFYTTSLPAGISYFIVRGTDPTAKSLLQTLLTAKASGMQVVITYNQVAQEGEVVAISIP